MSIVEIANIETNSMKVETKLTSVLLLSDN